MAAIFPGYYGLKLMMIIVPSDKGSILGCINNYGYPNSHHS